MANKKTIEEKKDRQKDVDSINKIAETIYDIIDKDILTFEEIIVLVKAIRSDECNYCGCYINITGGGHHSAQCCDIKEGMSFGDIIKIKIDNIWEEAKIIALYSYVFEIVCPDQSVKRLNYNDKDIEWKE